jgi:DNA-binding LacI/PurR family transcriptional regulator
VAVTLHDVARTAGVSIKTVSNVINGYPYIRADTRRRVEDAIAQLGYQPNLLARGLRSGRTGTISLVIPDLRNAYFAELADSVMRAASTHGLSVLIELSERNRERELAVLRGPRMHMVDGILFSPLALGQQDAGLLDIPTPVVLLGEQIFGGPTDHVTMQNVEAVEAATEHLLSLGRRRLLAFGAHRSESGGSSGLRLVGYRRAIEAAGLPFRQELVIEVWEWHRSDGAEAMREVLASGVAFDGVVAFNDSIALGAMRVLQEAGLRVPQDVAIIGFDDIDEASYSLPTLSTIDPGREEIADTAVRVLLERIRGSRPPAPPREYVTSFRVIQRESSAVTKAKHDLTGPLGHTS